MPSVGRATFKAFSFPIALYTNASSLQNVWYSDVAHPTAIGKAPRKGAGSCDTSPHTPQLSGDLAS